MEKNIKIWIMNLALLFADFSKYMGSMPQSNA